MIINSNHAISPRRAHPPQWTTRTWTRRSLRRLIQTKKVGLKSKRAAPSKKISQIFVGLRAHQQFFPSRLLFPIRSSSIAKQTASKMSTTSSNTAPVKWAQRSDSLYLTIALPGTFPILSCFAPPACWRPHRSRLRHRQMFLSSQIFSSSLSFCVYLLL
jgi:hypothetical protein